MSTESPVVEPTAVVAVANIAPSPTNPRKAFDKGALEELTDSVRKHGLLQPVLLRPWPEGRAWPKGQPAADTAVGGTYELVAGERRWRAARAAGLERIPALVRQLGDAEVLEIQIVENLQRSDLHPLEEAEGYEQLMKLHGYSVEDLAHKVGKSKAYVYARMKLTALKDETSRAAFLKGEIAPSVALLIARIPNERLQREFGRRVVHGLRYSQGARRGEALSYRDALELYHSEFMLRLTDAPWRKDDEQLVRSAGPCTTCPKRTGNQRELFEDVKSADVCTDTACFQAKKKAFQEARLAEFRATGRVVIEGKKAKELLPYGGEDVRGGLIRVDAQCWKDPQHRTYRSLLEKALATDATAQPAVVVAPDTGALIEVLEEKAANRLLREAGHKFALRQPSSGVSSSTRGASASPKAKAKAALDEAVRDALQHAVVERVAAAAERDKSSAKVIELLLLSSEAAYRVGEVLERRGLVSKLAKGVDGAAALRKAGALREAQLRSIALEATLRDDFEFVGGPLRTRAVAAYGIDEKKLEGEIRRRLEAEAAAKAGAKAPPAEKAKAAKRKA